ncbi:MAG: putative Ig domain-containing protein [Steroidobacter sp.]
MAISSVNANSAYSFMPNADDVDGDALTFEIQNKPEWASFSTTTGKLSGTPTLTHAGSFANIVISVSDGKISSALPAFSITVTQPTLNSVTLYWTAPTQNTDGSPVNLAGFTVLYGTSQSALHQSVRINNPGLNTYVLDSLPPGTYYFAVKAFSSDGAESSQSNSVSKVIS